MQAWQTKIINLLGHAELALVKSNMLWKEVNIHSTQLLRTAASYAATNTNSRKIPPHKPNIR